jgi:hypothetical protein
MSADPELVKYMKKHLKKGYKLHHIKQNLAKVGHSAQAIELAALEAVGDSAEKSSRLTIILLIVFIAVVGAGFVAFLAWQGSKVVEHTEKVKEIEKTNEYLGMTDVQLIMLAKDGDMQACDHIQSHNILYACKDKYWERDDCEFEMIVGSRDDCLNDKAKKSLNFNICSSISDDSLRENCKVQIIKSISDGNQYSACSGDSFCLDYSFINNIDSIDYDYCDLYMDPNSKDACILNISVHKSDSSMCDNINEMEWRDSCELVGLESYEQMFEFCKYRYSGLSTTFPEATNSAVCFYDLLNERFSTEGDCDSLKSFIADNKGNIIMREFKIVLDHNIEYYHSDDFNNTETIDVLECLS